MKSKSKSAVAWVLYQTPMPMETPKGVVAILKAVNAVLDMNPKTIGSPNEVIQQAVQYSRVYGMPLVKDFPPALSECPVGEWVLMASAKDEKRFLYAVKVSDNAQNLIAERLQVKLL